jgi:hypothetical protein
MCCAFRLHWTMLGIYLPKVSISNLFHALSINILLLRPTSYSLM